MKILKIQNIKDFIKLFIPNYILKIIRKTKAHTK